jgi:VWFA-related protein
MRFAVPIRSFRPAVWAVLMSLCPLPAQQPVPEPASFHAASHLVVLNVVVKDKHGKPVDDLKRDDFVLRDNDQEQKIAMFALDDSRRPDAASPSIAPLTFTNGPALGPARVTAFLYDELNTQLVDQQLAKKEFLKYLRGLSRTDRLAVFVLGDSLTLLHDFSQDTASLIAALDKHGSRSGPEAVASAAPPASSGSLTGDSTTTAQWDSFLASSNQPYTDYAETVRATRTAAALETIATHLQGVPGRKTLIWISGGFPIQLGLHNSYSMAQSNANARDSGRESRANRQGGGGRATGAGGGAARSSRASAGGNSGSSASNASSSGPPGMGLSFETDVERAVRALNESDVAVYPVDARGVTVAAPFQADRASIGKQNRPQRSNRPVDFNYETLEGLAEETGGRAFHQINDLHSAIQEAASDASVTYSIAFYPPAVSLDDAYHRLEVSSRRQDVKLRYRPGYVATSKPAVAPSLAEAVTQPIAYAGIGITAHLAPTDGGYKLSVTVDPRTITLEPKDGKWTGSLQFLVVVGKVEQLTTVPLTFSEAMFQKIQSEGLVLGARVKTPPGTTGFSLGFRDIPSGLVGTLHVPL